MGKFFLAYWTADELTVNAILLMHILIAFVLGMAIGYERAFHGHAAGMRTYGLVASSSAALVAAIAFPSHWYAGLAETPPAIADPTRVIQGVVTGIGFLGAGVILKEGFTIRGLSMAAAIWMTSAIGVLVGLGFVAVAGGGALLTIVAMALLKRFEERLPHQVNVHLVLAFDSERSPRPSAIEATIAALGCKLVETGYRVDREKGRTTFTMMLQTETQDLSSRLLDALGHLNGLVDMRLTPARN